MTDEPEQRRSLSLTVSPFAQRGETIKASIKAENVPETVVELLAPDTVVVSRPHRQVAGTGTFETSISWLVEHVQPGTTTVVEIVASAGSLVQTGLCRIGG